MRRVPLIVVVLILSGLVTSSAGAQEEVYLGGPPPGSGPVEVRFGFSLINITDINEQEETIDFDGLFFLMWKDARLAYDPQSVGMAGFVPGDYSGTPRRFYHGEFRVKEVYPGWRPHLLILNGIGDRGPTDMAVAVWPDGMVAYRESFHTTAETPMQLRLFPFDRQQLDIFVHPSNYSRDEVVLVPDDRMSRTWEQTEGIAGWTRVGVTTQERLVELANDTGSPRPVSEVVTTVIVKRQPHHFLISIVLPLLLLVSLTWVVFWMDEESITDRINISFVGILSVVAYYFVILSSIPDISYLTLMDAFIIATFFVLVGGVVVNVAVDKLNKAGRKAVGDRVDRTCRWAFPMAYALITLIVTLVFFSLN